MDRLGHARADTQWCTRRHVCARSSGTDLRMQGPMGRTQTVDGRRHRHRRVRRGRAFPGSLHARRVRHPGHRQRQRWQHHRVRWTAAFFGRSAFGLVLLVCQRPGWGSPPGGYALESGTAHGRSIVLRNPIYRQAVYRRPGIRRGSCSGPQTVGASHRAYS